MNHPTAVADYYTELPADRREAMERLRDSIEANLPGGFESRMNYGMPSWVVPHDTYPAGYHVKPELPLPFLSIASQRSHIAVYHMGIYASPPLMAWFVGEFPKHCSRKLNMGKSCIRFKNTKHIPFDLIGELCSKMSPQDWIEIYESEVK
ncbi:MAG: hypothetical protein CMH55_08740 [Myxococcales bacterium]|nr:hypothetical protein [Myxococcales bacterium]|tara:strand:- start:1051 stop:1500 length:450 start_codon:yes stop_codon:yes gene_type:complete